MKISFPIFFLLLFICCFGLNGQARKTKRPAKKPIIRATVVVKGGSGPIAEKKLPVETDDGLWNEFVDNSLELRMLFPAHTGDIWDESAAGKLRTLESHTANATYRLIVRNLQVKLDNRQIDQVLENVLTANGGSDFKLVEKRDIYYEGRLGKAIRTEQKNTIDFGRFYILNGQLFVLSVTIDKAKYSSSFDNWINKFFDSFSVKVSLMKRKLEIS